jgi:hypothetical protein
MLYPGQDALHQVSLLLVGGICRLISCPTSGKASEAAQNCSARDRALVEVEATGTYFIIPKVAAVAHGKDMDAGAPKADTMQVNRRLARRHFLYFLSARHLATLPIGSVFCTPD